MIEGSSAYEKGNPPVYEIRLKGEISSDWTEWFYGFEISCEQGTTLLTESVPDQAALHGLLRKILDLVLFLITVNCIDQNNKFSADPQPSDRLGSFDV